MLCRKRKRFEVMKDIFKAAGKTVQVGGNIGTAMCALAQSSSDSTFNVIEVSSFQLEGIRTFRPNTAAILNVTPDHLDRYPDFAAYRQAKLRIFENQGPNDAVVLNADDPQVWPMSPAPPSAVRLFSRKGRVENGAWRDGGELYLNGQLVLHASKLRLRGDHNIENALAAMALVDGQGVETSVIAQALAEFLVKHPRVDAVHYAGLPSHPEHEIARKQMRGFGGMMTFFLKANIEQTRKFLSTVELFTLAESLGGVESLIEHRASVEGPGTPCPPDLLRLSVGVEEATDLFDDLDQALKRAHNA